MKKIKQSKKQQKKLSVKALQTEILQLFRDNPDKKFSARHIIEILGIGNNKDSVVYALDQLENSGQLKAARRVNDISPKLTFENQPENLMALRCNALEVAGK